MSTPFPALLAAAALAVSLTGASLAPAGPTGALEPAGAPAPTAAALGVPKSFPLPAGAKARIVRDGKEYAGTITVKRASAAFAFWKKQLPRRGYTVRSAERVGGYGEIRFRGHGCVGNSQLAFTGGRTVAYQCVHA